MATVAVTSFAEFVVAAAVAGDTVVCPVKAKWELNDLYPEGYNGNINLHCAEIQGNGTTINNLHIYGRFYKKYELRISDLNITNFVCDIGSTGTARYACFIGSDNSETGNLYIDGCIISGICNNNVERFSYKNPTLNRCSFNIQFAKNGGNVAGIFPVAEAKYCRIRQDSPNIGGVNSTISLQNCKFSEIDLQWSGATSSKTVELRNLFGCKIIGNAGAARTYGTGTPDFQNIIIDTFSTEQTSMTTCAAVTFAQMYDAAYLASLGFPVGVS